MSVLRLEGSIRLRRIGTDLRLLDLMKSLPIPDHWRIVAEYDGLDLGWMLWDDFTRRYVIWLAGGGLRTIDQGRAVHALRLLNTERRKLDWRELMSVRHPVPATVPRLGTVTNEKDKP